MPEWVKLVELKTENGMRLPTLDGRFFCSRRDPKREAQSWLQSQRRLISENKTLVVLGLGAGFHIEALQAAVTNPIHVIELRPELIGHWQIHNSESKIQVSPSIVPSENLQILEFRPAWNGLEVRYENLSRELRSVHIHSLRAEAEAHDLWILSDALKKANLPENLELTIKDIVHAIPLENQSEEARIWRALRELVL